VRALRASDALGGLSRPLFVVGCAAAGWLAWQRSTAAHIQSAILLFAFAPFVRRVIDVSVGYDAASIMLIGPLLFILMPLPSLWTLLSSREQLRDPWLIAPAIVLACIAYGAMLSIFQNDWMSAATGALKWAAPVLYGIALQQRATQPHQKADLFGIVFVVDDNLIGNKKAIKPTLRDIVRWQQERAYPLTLFTEASLD